MSDHAPSVPYGSRSLLIATADDNAFVRAMIAESEHADVVRVLRPDGRPALTVILRPDMIGRFSMEGHE